MVTWIIIIRIKPNILFQSIVIAPGPSANYYGQSPQVIWSITGIELTLGGRISLSKGISAGI